MIDDLKDDAVTRMDKSVALCARTSPACGPAGLTPDL